MINTIAEEKTFNKEIKTKKKMIWLKKAMSKIKNFWIDLMIGWHSRMKYQ